MSNQLIEWYGDEDWNVYEGDATVAKVGPPSSRRTIGQCNFAFNLILAAPGMLQALVNIAEGNYDNAHDSKAAARIAQEAIADVVGAKR